MPIYAYKCQKCNESFDVRASIQQRMTGLKPACPHCGSQVVQAVISVGTVLRDSSGAPIPSSGSGCCPGGSGCCQ